jgi:hypothetical protein
VNFDDYPEVDITGEKRLVGEAVVARTPEAWLSFQDVDFDGLPDWLTARAVSVGDVPTTIEVRLDNLLDPRPPPRGFAMTDPFGPVPKWKL